MILEAYSDTGSVQRYWKRTVILAARCSQTIPADQSRFVSSKGYEYDDYQDKLSSGPTLHGRCVNLCANKAVNLEIKNETFFRYLSD